MYEQFLYYWLLWIIFIIVAFFMKKNLRRSYLMGWLLIIIICSPYYVSFSNLQISVAFFIMLIGSIIFYAFESISIYKFIVTFTVMICYISLLIWEKITPVWFFMPSYFIIPFITVLLISLLISPLFQQIVVALIGVAIGQLLFQFIIISYRLHYIIDSEEFFIHVSLIVLFQTILHFFHLIINKISHFFERKFT